MPDLALRLAQQEPGLGFLVTSSGELTEGRVNDAGMPFWQVAAPADKATAVREFLDRWKPTVGVWTECDLKPALVTETHKARIPLLMVDARTARPDPRSWRWRPRQARTLLGRFDQILAGDEAAALDLRRMGADAGRLAVTGFLEEGSAALPCNERDRDALAELLSGRPVWLAAGVTAGEETEAVLSAHRRAVQRAHRLLLVIAPESPAEGPALAQRLIEDHWSIALRSAGEEPGRDTQIYVADSEGEMGLWYRLAPISFLGRSLGTGTGRNPFQAAALGSAILHGPNIKGHRDAYARLSAAGATRLVQNAEALGIALEETLAPDVTADMAHEAWRICSQGAEVTDRVIALILNALDQGQAA